MTSNVINY